MISAITSGWRWPCTSLGWDFTPPPCCIPLWSALCCGCWPNQIRWEEKLLWCKTFRMGNTTNLPLWWAFFQTSRDICCVVFALFNVVWATLFLERWKRREAELAYKWGTLDPPAESLEEPRPQFRVKFWIFVFFFSPSTWLSHTCLLPLQGVKRCSPITGREEFYYPPWRRRLFRWLVSLPVCILCICFVFLVMLICFELQVSPFF